MVERRSKTSLDDIANETNGIASEANDSIASETDNITSENIVVTERKSTTALWGRAWNVDSVSFLGSAFLLFVCPFFPAVFHLSCRYHQCSLTKTLLCNNFTSATFYIPTVGMEIILVYGTWILLQVLLNILPDYLHYVLPRYSGGHQTGTITPAGNALAYNINGLQAWLITHVLWLLNAYYFEFFSPSLISRNMLHFLVIANVAGYVLATFSYVKAHLFPNDRNDCKFSGSFIYDYLMGVEFNPRIGKCFDFKLFFNGRPGIICWTLINFSFAWHQYEEYGHVTNSMIMLNFLHALYVVDFFWNEAWYLGTIDICHEHFGWYLAWGDLVWLPYMYTLQGLYLVYNPIELECWQLALILAMGLIGYWIFRSSNHQKDVFRKDPERCVIWGEKAQYIKCRYKSGDGRQHESSLLTSGWWGIARHMNYTGDLLGSLAYCLCCGGQHILPYFYIIYMCILLVHRIYRDEHRCEAKYGRYWDEYTSKVPYRLLPGIY